LSFYRATITFWGGYRGLLRMQNILSPPFASQFTMTYHGYGTNTLFIRGPSLINLQGDSICSCRAYQSFLALHVPDMRFKLPVGGARKSKCNCITILFSIDMAESRFFVSSSSPPSVLFILIKSKPISISSTVQGAPCLKGL
jgi:hypothetical protein